jgi:hypothetical protein
MTQRAHDIFRKLRRMSMLRVRLSLAVASLLIGCGSSGASGGDAASTLGDSGTTDGTSAADNDGGGFHQDAVVLGQVDAGNDSAKADAHDAATTDGTTGDATGVSADTGTPDGFVTATHAAQPQVVTFGGPVLTAPKVQPILYAEDPMATDVEAMVQEFASEPAWAAQTAEYGVGSLTVLPTISIAGTPPTTLDDNNGNPTPFEKTLATNTSGANPAWGPADASTIYLFVLPKGTNISSGGSCCTDFLGYHYEVPVGSTSVPYAIVCDCAPQQGDPTTPLVYVTTTVSHELVESATDPYPDSNPAYVESDDNDIDWSIETGGEVADMCEYNTDTNYTPSGSTYAVQRSWSNAAASAGTNPCVPVPPTGPFFNSMPVLPDTVSVDYYGQAVQTKGVTIAVGQSATIDVQLYSEAATNGPWTVTVYDLSDYLGDTPDNQVSLDKATGSNGDVLHLTIKAKHAATNGGGFILISDLGGQENFSMGTVAN